MALADLLPTPYRVVARHQETTDTATLRLAPVAEPLPPFRPGQFTMLYAHGVGEIPISISGDPSVVDGSLTQTVRVVGAVSRAVADAEPGALLGVRGPFGVGWDVESAAGQDLVVVAGGLGLAPLRPVVLAALADRIRYRRVTLIVGARTAADFLFRHQLDGWAARPDLDVRLTVDRATDGWTGPVGFVTEPLARLDLDPARTVAFLCGPEPMMRFSAGVLLRRGVPAEAIRLSLERTMLCGVALCGHCQLGPLLVCRDGPVVAHARVADLLTVREL